MLSPLLSLVLLLPALQNPPAPAPAPAPAPEQQKPAPAKPAAPQNKVNWFAGGLEKALAEAKSSNKIVFVEFNATWCTWCMKMNREVFSTDEAQAALEPVICVSIDYDKHRDIADRYLKDNKLPVSLWLNSDGSVRERIDGFQDKPHFLANAARIKADIGTINDLRRKVEGSPADLDQRYELYRRLLEVGDPAGAAAQRAEIQKADPQGKSRAMHHFRYDAIKAEINAYWQQTKSLDPKQIQGLWNFMEVETDPELVWDGWMSLGNTYKWWGEQAQARGESPEAKKNRQVWRDCLGRAWRGIPQDDDTLRSHVTGYTSVYWDLRDELSAEDKALLLSMNEMTSRRLDTEALVMYSYAQALFLSGKSDAAQAACERAIELAQATGVDPQNFQKTLELIRGGAK